LLARFFVDMPIIVEIRAITLLPFEGFGVKVSVWVRFVRVAIGLYLSPLIMTVFL